MSNNQNIPSSQIESHFKNFLSALACEGNSVILSCSKGGLINILKAFYGRRSNDVCSLTRGARDMNCRGSDLHVVEKKCQGKKFCVLMASRRTFGDVCGGIPAYLEIDYACNLREGETLFL